MPTKDFQAGTGSDAERRIPLSVALRNAVVNVLQAYRDLDWDEIESADIDCVVLHFERQDGLEKADKLMHELALADSLQRTKFSHRWAKHLECCLNPLQTHIQKQLVKLKAAGPNFQQPTTTMAEALRLAKDAIKLFKGSLKQFDELPDETPPRRASDLWRKLNEELRVHGEIFQIATKVALDLRPKGLYLAFCLQKVAPPVRVANSADNWFSLPLRGHFVAETLKFCHTISAINLPVNSILMPTPCCRELDVYTQVFRHCGLLRVELPSQDAVDPGTAAKLDDQMENLNHHLANLFNILFPAAQLVPLALAAVSSKPVATTEGHVSLDEALSSAPARASESIQSSRESANTTINPDRPLSNQYHTVVIMNDGSVELDGDKVQNSLPVRTFRALADLAQVVKEDRFSIDKNKLINIVYQNCVRESRRHNLDNCLRNLKRLCNKVVIKVEGQNRIITGLVLRRECEPDTTTAKLQ